MKTQEAQEKAKQAGLDLVLVAENARPPVVRIKDHGKYQYRQRKKEQKSKKAGEMKEVRLTINIDQHDIDFKLKQAQKFLKNLHPLKVSLPLFGREQGFGQRAQAQIDSFIKQLANVSDIDQAIRREGRTFTAILKPK